MRLGERNNLLLWGGGEKNSDVAMVREGGEGGVSVGAFGLGCLGTGESIAALASLSL